MKTKPLDVNKAKASHAHLSMEKVVEPVIVPCKKIYICKHPAI